VDQYGFGEIDSPQFSLSVGDIELVELFVSELREDAKCFERIVGHKIGKRRNPKPIAREVGGLIRAFVDPSTCENVKVHEGTVEEDVNAVIVHGRI